MQNALHVDESLGHRNPTSTCPVSVSKARILRPISLASSESGVTDASLAGAAHYAGLDNIVRFKARH